MAKEKISAILPFKLSEKLMDGRSINEMALKERNVYYKTVKLIDRIVSRKMMEDQELGSSFPLSSKYIKKIVHPAKYEIILNSLTENEILIKTRNYSTSNSRCNQYKINSDLLSSKHIQIEYEQIKRKREEYHMAVEKVFNQIEFVLPNSPAETVKPYIQQFKESIRERIDFERKKYTPRKGRKRSITKPVEDFLQDRVDYWQILQASKLKSIVDHNWHINRNETNNRLDTVFTNLFSGFRKFIQYQGNPMKQIDLANSQFCIFSNLLLDILHNNDVMDLQNSIDLGSFRKACFSICTNEGKDIKSDVTDFCNASIDGTLYDHIKTCLDLETRSEAKQLAFELFFGCCCKVDEETNDIDFTDDSSNMEKLSELYPSIVEVVKYFKFHCTLDKQNERNGVLNWKTIKAGYAQFSIMLQKIESNIFIDIILLPLLDQGHILITCHDSFFYTSEEARATIENKLNILLPFGYTLKED